jgi:anaerobic magnesium-protoporphyrin IX monomethyl ester cyclase
MNVLRKGITIEQAEKAFALTKKASIEILGYFMIGNPTETREDILETIRFAKKIKPDYAHFSITTPFPATDLYRMGLEKGILPHDYWREFAKNPTKDFVPLFWEENLDREELIALLKYAYRSFYFRPAYILERIAKIRSWKELKTKTRIGFNLLKV